MADERLIGLHRDGLSTVAIGRTVGLDPSVVWRRLHALGIDLRRPAHNRVDVDEAVVLAAVDAGARAPWVAAELGVPVATVRRVMRANGRRGIPGRPRP